MQSEHLEPVPADPRAAILAERLRTFPDRFPTLDAYALRAAPAFALVHVEAEHVPASILSHGFGFRIEPEALALRAVQEPVHASGTPPRYRWHVLDETFADSNTADEIRAEEAREGCERVHVVVLPRDPARSPYVLAPCTRFRALDVLARFHAPEALAWDFLPASDVRVDTREPLAIYTLESEPVDGYPTGGIVFGVWDARYRDDDARPMLRIVCGATADRSRILRPYTSPGIVRVATLDDVRPLDSDKVARVWDFEDCGVDSASYFRGAGCDDFEDCAVGCGNTPREALDDALDMLASSGWDVGACALAIPADNAGAWDRDMVSEALAEHVEPARVRVRFLASCGMDTAEGGTFDDVDDALESVARILAEREALDGFEVDTFEDGADMSREVFADFLRGVQERHDDGESWTWEARAGDDVHLIPDTDGTLHLEILRGVPLDEIAEDSDLSYRVAVRVSEREESEDDDAQPVDALAIVQALAQSTADKRRNPNT